VPHGFYATPEDATVALVRAISPYLDNRIHEPACGDGRIARVLSRYGYDVVSTDLIDRGYGTGGVDFLTTGPVADTVITNPPFHLAEQFIMQAVPRARLVALLLKANYWHTRSRIALYKAFPPRQQLMLTWRLDFTGGGSPTMDCTWWVWGDHLPSVTRLLPKPGHDVFA
jgi:hypothetical protein